MFRRDKKFQNVTEIREALAKVQIWRRDKSHEIFCPICDAPGFEIIDRSARPYTEWYSVKCQKCGIEDSIAVPLCPQMGGGN